MRILIVSETFPWDLSIHIHGVFKRFRMFLDAIKEIAEIDLLYYVPSQLSTSPSSVAQLELSLSTHFKAPIRLFLCQRSDSRNFITKLWDYTVGAFISFRRPLFFVGTAGTNQVRAFEACLDYKPDAIFVHRLGAMCPILLTRKSLPPVFFDLDDVENISYGRRIRYLSKKSTKLLSYLLLPAIFWDQYRSVRLAHRTFVCSEVDRRYLTNRCHLKGVAVIPNAVKIPAPQTPSLNQTLLFIGSYWHKPNIDAVEFLIREIWPLVHQRVPAATLTIAGSPPDNIPSYRTANNGISFAGFVEDLDGLYRQSRVVCVPIRSGSGTRLKIIEAAAYSRPVVSTCIGAEGIEMRNGYEIMLRDDPESFAEACIRLLNDYDSCEQMGTAAHAAILKKYNQLEVKHLIQKYITPNIAENL